jgi:ABC-type multidrug transport system fused ATPase/permease subunit
VIYFIISTFTKRRLAADSTAIATALDGRLKTVQESLGGIREVIIDGSQASYLAAFERENSRLSRARASVAITSATPRYLIEAAGMVAIAGIALAAFQREGGLGAAIPTLGAIALGAQRLMPLVQQVYRGWSTASGHLSLVAQTTELLNLPAEQESQSSEGPRLTFADKITVSGVGFAYPGRRNSALRRIHFEIPAGSALGVIGETGSGKTTLVDLLMGLMEPDEGHVLVDGVRLTTANRRSWQRSIAHVPQSIFLADASIWRNIGLSLPNLAPDQDRIVDAAKRAQLHDFIMSLPGEYETIVGERGIRLSGGQRQRLGLARAIYKDAPVFVLDEATSALDDATEDAVMGALDSLRRQGRTLIIVAHRISTISRCDWIARLDDGRLAEFGRLNEVLATDQVYAKERRSRSTFD